METPDWTFVPLLSGKSLEEFTAEEFKLYIESLFSKPEPLIKDKPPFTWRINKKGTLCLRVNRMPKWINQDEFESLIEQANISKDQLEKKLNKSKIEIRIE